MGFNETKNSVSEKVKEASETVHSFAEDLPKRMEEARDVANDWKAKAETLIREKPGTCLIGAFAIGFLLAKVARHA